MGYYIFHVGSYFILKDLMELRRLEKVCVILAIIFILSLLLPSRYSWFVFLPGEVLGWGLPSQFPPFRYFLNFSELSKHTLNIKYHVYI